MLWINFLHLYQPANSDAYKIEEASDLSYQRVVEALLKNKDIKFTFNISGCLVERLAELKKFDLIKKINILLERGQMELVGSAAYHALLPLIDEKEIIWQINEQEKIIKKYFPKAKLRGFFLPEMAYSPKVARVIKKSGYDWLIIDEISYSGNQKLDFNEIYIDKNSGLKIIFRSRKLSNSYVPEKIIELLDKGDDRTIITATDGELYGLRHNDNKKILEKSLKRKGLETILISDYVKKGRQNKEILLRESNWESTEKYLREGKPFHLWYNNSNRIQLKLWDFVSLAIKLINKYKKDQNHHWARWHFVRGLASCTFWWASAYDFKHNFGPRAWSPDEIERGVDEFIRAIRSLEDSTSRSEKIMAENFLISIKKMVWVKHWTHHKK
ncbi:MAG TPA: hypothetical protein PK142_00325 [bacterium]|nr:hypothetical protein [bacterium]